MSTIVIYGASDNCIEVEGDISEEFSYSEDEPNLLAFSNGTLLDITYTKSGVWRITHLAGKPCSSFAPAVGSDDDNYSDRATLEGVEWVVFGHHIEKVRPVSEPEEPTHVRKMGNRCSCGKRASECDSLVGEPEVSPEPTKVWHEVTLVMDEGRLSAAWFCNAPEGASCRMVCSKGCEQWDADHECGLVDGGTCNVVEWLENVDLEESHAGGPQVLYRGTFDYEYADGYTWWLPEEVKR